MSYIINKTDGSIVTEIIDGMIDQEATSLTLIGKNVSSYGGFLNENLIYLLENFANTSSPTKPITGQLWYDTSESRLKVYDGNGFKVSGGTIVSSIIPSNLVAGDIWIDSYSQQLHFNDGTETLLLGPIYSLQQGKSGFEVIDIIDSNNLNRTIVVLWCNQAILGIFSKETFSIATGTIPGFTGNTINAGFTGNTSSTGIFDVVATSATSLIAEGDIVRVAEDFLLATDNTATIGTMSIVNERPLLLGSASETEIKVNSAIAQINSNVSNQNFGINVISGSSFLPAFRILSQPRQVGIFTDLPTATLDVNGTARIRGDLTVEGNLTTISTTNVEISDKLIELAKVDSPSNATANGGGILIEGGSDSDKTWTWSSTSSAWTSSEHIDIAAGKEFKINNQTVLTSSTITVSNAPNLTNVGTLTAVRVANLGINTDGTSANTISFVNPSVTDGDVVLLPKGTGTVNVSGSRITNVATAESATDAVNVEYLTDTLKSVTLGLWADTTGLDDLSIANAIEVVYPAGNYNIGTVCRMYCVDNGVGIGKGFIVNLVAGLNTWQYNGTL